MFAFGSTRHARGLARFFGRPERTVVFFGLSCAARARAVEPGNDATPIVEVTAPRPEPSYAATLQQTASRGDAPLRDVPQSMTVIDRTLMDDVGARRTDDVMLLVPGVQLFSGYGGTWDDYTVRGFHVWSATTYRDGFVSGYSGANAVDAVNVERVEVLRGPASALYGPGLPGGSINFVTKRPLPEQRFRTALTGGSFGTVRAELDATGPVTDRLRYRVTASADRTDGYRDFNTFRRWLVNPVIEYRVAPGTSLLVEAQAYDVDYRADPAGVPIVNRDPFALPVNRSYIEPDLPLASVHGTLGRIELTRELTPDWSLRISAEDKTGGYSEETILTAGLSPDERTLVRPVINWASTSADTALQLALHGRVTTGPFEHVLLFGSDAGEERVEWRAAGTDPTAAPFPIDLYSPRYGAPIPSVPLPGGAPNVWGYRAFGVYANDVVTLLPWLDASAGARADAYRQSSYAPPVVDHAGEVAVSPRAAVLLRPSSIVSLFANANAGFWPSLGITADGHVLHPEHSLTYEAGARVALDRDRATLDVSVFRARNRNIAVTDPNNPNFQVQRGEATSRGIEVEATAHAGHRFRFFGSYALTDARVTADLDPANVGSRLPFAAVHTGAFWVQTSLFGFSKDGPSLGLGGTFTSQRALLDHTMIPGYARFDATAGYRFGSTQFVLRVENLAGVRYVRGGNDGSQILPGAPRSAFLTFAVALR